MSTNSDDGSGVDVPSCFQPEPWPNSFVIELPRELATLLIEQDQVHSCSSIFLTISLLAVSRSETLINTQIITSSVPLGEVQVAQKAIYVALRHVLTSTTLHLHPHPPRPCISDPAHCVLSR